MKKHSFKRETRLCTKLIVTSISTYEFEFFSFLSAKKIDMSN